MRTLASHDRDVIPEEPQSSILLQSIKSVLYDCFYCPGIPTPLEFILEQTRAGVQIEEAWSATNNGGGHWQPGWRVVAAGDKSVIAERRDLKVRVAKAETSKGADGEFAVGDEISVRHPKELRTFSPGFFYIVGDQPISAEDRDQLLRVYWNLTPSIAADFIGVLTRALNDLGVPFQFKVWKNVGARMRCDSGVLYLSRRHYAQARPALESTHRSLGDQLNPGEPAFCKVLAPGVGLAEDPGSNKSFGMHRCELTAKGVIGAHQLGERRLPERLERVREAFRSSQVVFDQPYLQPGSIDAYRFVSTATKSTKVTTPRSDNVANNSVETAAVIGRLLCDRAIWADGRCCWIGPARPGGPTGLSALGPDIYSGTAGVALFLATLGSLTNEPTAKSTALAAIRHATEHVDGIPDRAIGFYSGSAGVAFAAYHVGTLLEDDELHDAGIEVLKRLPDPDSITEPDLISGHAGLIVAVGALNGASRLPWLANRIRSHGDELLGSARTQKDRLFLRSGANRRGLLGMAHGTSGIGWALVELFALTGDDRYAEAAHAAFRYDNAAFDPDSQNWPDLRYHSARDGVTPGVFTHFWCHGSAGIALSRQRAHHILRRPEYAADCAMAGKAAADGLASGLEAGRVGGFGLCHGLPGCADVLIELAKTSSERVSQRHRALAHEVGATGIDRFARSAKPWQQWSDAPGLLDGLAGIGYFYLRLASPDLLCILGPVAGQASTGDHNPTDD